MKLSYAWLGEMVDLSTVDPAEVQRLLTFHTAEVEDAVPVGAGLEDVRTARVEAVRPHPDADKLRLCTVRVSPDEDPIEVVCGAPNVAAGQVVAYAPEGATLPGGPEGEPFLLERRTIRGVESRGMILSERELALGDDHDGILVLPEGAPVGVPLADVLPVADTILEVDNVCVTHRPDLWGHVGWARELGALLGTGHEAPAGVAEEELPQDGEAFPIRIDDAQGCRRYVGVVIEGLVNGPSPLALRRRLAVLGVRSIGLVVDLTNLVLLELGQPLHAFDLGAVRGGAIHVRAATAGEIIETLDGTSRTLVADDLVIADEEGPVAIAGVMGGAESEVRAGTRAILLESATFDPVRVRRTAARLGLRSEASTRFEKSLDDRLALQAALRFLALVREHVPGATVSRPLTDVHPRPHPELELRLPYALVRRRLGARIPDHRVRAILGALGFETREEGEAVRVRVPSWRATKDVQRAEDLVEEVGRIAGYDRIPSVAPVVPMAPRPPPPERALERRVAAILSLDMGCAEVKHRSFYSAEEAARLGLDDDEHLRVLDPSSAEHSHMMRSTAPAMLQTVARNQVGFPEGAAWESARLFVPRPGSLPREHPVLALVRWGSTGEDGARFLDAVDDVRHLAGRLGIGDLRVAQATEPALAEGLPLAVWLHPGRTAVVRWRDRTLAVVGEVLPAVARRYGLQGRTALADVASEVLLDAWQVGGVRYAPVLRVPVVPFDVAVVVPRRTPADDVRRAIEGAVAGHVRDLHVFDVYEGGTIPEGMRSIAWRCELFDRERTLSSKAAAALRKRVTDALEAAGWSVRTG